MTNIFDAGLTPDRENANEGTQRGRGLLEKSLRQLGAGRSILTDKDGNVIAGNKTLESAADIDLPVRIVETDGNELVVVKRTDLDLYSETDKRARKLAYADNMVGSIDLAWKPEQIAVDFEPLELKEWGFENPNPPVADAEPQIDKAAELNEKWQVKAGDLWQIGEHRLLCGDSTKREDVERVMQGEKAGMMVTDPPYGVEYNSEWRVEAGIQERSFNSGKVENDDISDWTPAWQLFNGDVAYIWHAGVFSNIVQASIESCGFLIRAQIIWNKDLAVFGRGDYHWKHEPCWYAVRKGTNGNRTEDRKQSTVWDIPTIHSFANGHNAEEWKLTGHGTQKPLECMERPIRNHDFEIIYEPFCGSGTTMVACENLSRKCRAIEISPNYCAVILERMATAFHELTIGRIE